MISTDRRNTSVKLFCWNPVLAQVGFRESPFQDVAVGVLRVFGYRLTGHRHDRRAVRVQRVMDSRIQDCGLTAAPAEIWMRRSPIRVCRVTADVDSARSRGTRAVEAHVQVPVWIVCERCEDVAVTLDNDLWLLRSGVFE